MYWLLGIFWELKILGNLFLLFGEWMKIPLINYDRNEKEMEIYAKDQKWVRDINLLPLSIAIFILYCMQLKNFINSIIIEKTKPKKKKEIWVPSNRFIRGLKSPWPWCRVVFKLTNMKWTRLMRRRFNDYLQESISRVDFTFISRIVSIYMIAKDWKVANNIFLF